MNRLLIYSCCNPSGEIPSHVLYTLEKMRPFYKRAVFVSGCALREEDKARAQRHSDKILAGDGSGPQAGSWKTALMEEGWDRLKAFDQLLLMDDSFFGPLCDMEQVFEKMEVKGVDFWGLVGGRQDKGVFRMPGGRSHQSVQGNFMCFAGHVVSSAAFRDFWERPDSVKTGRGLGHDMARLKKRLLRSGFHFGVFPQKEGWSPGLLLKHGIPFLQVSDFLDFYHPPYLKQLIGKCSDYPVNLMDEHISSTCSPNVSLKVMDKNLVTSMVRKNQPISSSIAVHLHVYYVDVFEKLFERLEKSGLQADLFITTDEREKKAQVMEMVREKGKEHLVQEIVIYENRGRDMFPWLDLSEKLRKYDIVGHFHTKKTSWADDWIGDSWMEEILCSLIDPAREVIGHMEAHPNAGIVIPDIPLYHRFIPDRNIWAGNKAIFKRLWMRLGLKKQLNFKALHIPVMPYGNMFWYRPDALKPLFELGLSARDFPAEPMPHDDTIAHAMERLPVYVAWGQGYDFRVAVNSENIFSGFDYKIRNYRAQKMYDSLTWSIGRIFTFLPGRAVDWLRSVKML